MKIDFPAGAMDDVLDIVTWPVAVKGASDYASAGSAARRDRAVKAQVRAAFISEGRAQPISKALRTLPDVDQISAIGR